MNQQMHLLSPYRVLDLADYKGALCGSILASMGADVIKVEPLAGCSTRQQTPFIDDKPGAENSLVHWELNQGKRSVTLALDTDQGAKIFKQLLLSADFLIESFKPGTLQELGFGYEEVRRIAPSLIYVSISPYGHGGPRSQWEASDINIQAMGGHMYLSGDIDCPPVRVGVDASYLHGASEAASAAMVALHHRRRTGHGQHVDISMQQCIIWTLLNTTMTWQMVKRQEMRGGAVRKERGNTVYTRMIWPCKDGEVLFIPIGGGGGEARSKSYTRFVDWMKQEGFYDEALTARDWNNKEMYSFTQSEYDKAADVICAFLKTKTVSVLYERAVAERFLLAPINSVETLLRDPQLIDREFFRKTQIPGAGREFRRAGAFARFSQTPLISDAPAPRLGAHTEQILSELGYQSEQAVAALRASNVI